LLGQRFVVRIDHRSLKYLWDQTIVMEAQQKWLIKLVGDDFAIEYKKGLGNSVANGLSRRMEGSLVAFSQPLPRWVVLIQEEIIGDQELLDLISSISRGDTVGPWSYKEGLFFYKNIIYLKPNSQLTQTIIEEFHKNTHEGYQKGLQRIGSVFFWAGMR
jgi:hypothetical protein